MGVSGRLRRSMRWALAALVVAALALGIGPAAADWDTGQAAFERGDIAAALEAWRPLAEAGDARAQAAIGSLYIHGQGGGSRSTMPRRCAGPGAPPSRATSPAVQHGHYLCRRPRCRT